MEFKEFATRVESEIDQMVASGYTFFSTNITKDQIWETYLNSFTGKADEIFRVRRHHDSQYDANFIRNIGRLVAIKNGNRRTIWPDVDGDDVYGASSKACRDLVLGAEIDCVYVTNERTYGHAPSLDNHNKEIVWDHFLCEVPAIWRAPRGKNAGECREESRVDARLLKDLMDIGSEILGSVCDHCRSGEIYRLNQSAGAAEKALEIAHEYEMILDADRSDWLWEKSFRTSTAVCRMINSSVGVFILGIASDDPLQETIDAYEKIMDPARYQRVQNKKVSDQQLAKAKQFLTEGGFLGSLQRRHATLDDLRPGANALFVDADVIQGERIADIFEAIQEKQGIDPEKVRASKSVTLEEFVKNILPQATKLELLLENRHLGNLVSVVAPGDSSAPSIMKWANGFSHIYEGGVADGMQQRVKEAGGSVDGEARFTIQWNDQEREAGLDLDAHCLTPRQTIYFGNKYSSSGSLDVDIQNPRSGVPAVENITFPTLESMPNGEYKFEVHNYSGNSRAGFRAQVAILGKVYHYDHQKSVGRRQPISVATITVKKGEATIKHHLPFGATSGASSVEKWGVSTNSFHEVSALMLSPNCWENSEQFTGQKHHIICLKGAQNNDSFRGFVNEFLRPELREYRKVMESMADLITVQPTDDQLAGVGFNSDREMDFKLRVDGNQVLEIRTR